jgi:hypothetical protein
MKDGAPVFEVTPAPPKTARLKKSKAENTEASRSKKVTKNNIID